MPAALLSESRRAPRPAIGLGGGIALARGRVHEAAGPARHAFAAMIAGTTAGTVLWIAPAWTGAALNPDGAARFFDPGRLIFVRPHRAEDLLWAMEEALRAGVVPLVLADLPEAPALTPVRRLLLAAETSGAAPLGLLLTPGEGGAGGVESRWHMAPRHAATETAWQLERRRARTDPPRRWTLRQRGGKVSLSD